MTSGGEPDRTQIIRRSSGAFPDSPPTLAASGAESQTSIIRRFPTGSFPALPEPSPEEAATQRALSGPAEAVDEDDAGPANEAATSYLPRPTPRAVGGSGAARTSPTVPCAAIASILGVRASSRQVSPPRSGSGRPAAPSMINTQYFTLSPCFPSFQNILARIYQIRL